MTHADISGYPMVTAAAARELSIVLRHQGQHATARRVISDAVGRVERAGLTTPTRTAAWAQMLCTTSYTLARSGDSKQALEMIWAATDAARHLPAEAPQGQLFPITPAAVHLYAVGVHWALGDVSSALKAARTLRPEQFPTPERRARMHTDLARVWWLAGKAEPAAAELLAALRVSPGEVRDRSSIRGMAAELTRRHPHVSGVRELAAVARRGASPGE
jgi:hypothetical protein